MSVPPVHARRLGYVLPVLEPGGAERQILLLAAGLPRDRFAPELIVLGDAGPGVVAARHAGLVVHALGAPRRRDVGAIRFALGSAGVAWRFVRLVRRRRYDVLDAWLFPAYVLAALTRPFTRVPVLVTGRRSLSAWKERFGPLPRALDAVARRASDAIVANSDAVAADAVRVERLSPGRVRVIRNAVEAAGPGAAADIAALRAAAGVPDGGRLVGCVANPRPDKGLDVLLAALALRPLPPDVRVTILGAGPGRAALEAQARAAGLSEIVHWAGTVADARRLQPAFDVVVGPSRAEGLPNAILEAALAGRPIVATRAGGTDEILTDGETGLLVPVGDPAALRDGLDRLLADRVEARRLGDAAAQDVARRFGVARLVAETATLYDELLAARGR
jgi:glycosyltransferase involved in cell wall biosynthesis